MQPLVTSDIVYVCRAWGDEVVADVWDPNGKYTTLSGIPVEHRLYTTVFLRSWPTLIHHWLFVDKNYRAFTIEAEITYISTLWYGVSSETVFTTIEPVQIQRLPIKDHKKCGRVTSSCASRGWPSAVLRWLSVLFEPLAYLSRSVRFFYNTWI